MYENLGGATAPLLPAADAHAGSIWLFVTNFHCVFQQNISYSRLCDYWLLVCDMDGGYDLLLRNYTLLPQCNFINSLKFRLMQLRYIFSFLFFFPVKIHGA